MFIMSSVEDPVSWNDLAIELWAGIYSLLDDRRDIDSFRPASAKIRNKSEGQNSYISKEVFWTKSVGFALKSN